MEKLIKASITWPFPMYIRLAKGGDAESNFILGVGEIQGFLTQNDNKIQNAKFYLETAYSQGYKPASLWLALSNSCSFTNDSPGCDERQAEALLNENSYDIPLADFLLAKLYLDQNKSLSASLRLAEKASASGVTPESGSNIICLGGTGKGCIVNYNINNLSRKLNVEPPDLNKLLKSLRQDYNNLDNQTQEIEEINKKLKAAEQVFFETEYILFDAHIIVDLRSQRWSPLCSTY